MGRGWDNDWNREFGQVRGQDMVSSLGFRVAYKNGFIGTGGLIPTQK